MKIAYNPEATALTAAPSNNDITFDLAGKAIYARGVKFEGTNTTYSVFKKHTSDNSGGYDGLVPVPSYTTTTIRYLREDGNWEVPIMSEAVTDLGTDGNYITWTKNNIVNKLTVPYATSAGSLGGYNISNFMVYADHSEYVAASFTDENLSKKATEKYIEYWDSAGWFNSAWGQVTANYGFVGNLTGTASYATSADNSDKLDNYHESDFFRYRGALYQKHNYDADVLGIGEYAFRSSAYGSVGTGDNHVNALSENSTILVFKWLQLSTSAWSDDVAYRVNWTGETNSNRPNGWSPWIYFLSTVNSSVSGGGSSGGSSITVNIGGTSKTLTIPTSLPANGGTADYINYTSRADKGNATAQFCQYSGETNNPTNDWYSHIIMNHANIGGYYTEIATCFHSDSVYFRRQVNGTTNTWKQFAWTSDIPTVTDYYWANVQVSSSSNPNTSPTFASATVTDRINATNYVFLNPNGSGIYLNSNSLNWHDGSVYKQSLINFTSDGKVGIGTATPSYKLDVTNNAKIASICFEKNDEINRYGGHLYLQHRGTIEGSQGSARTGNILMVNNGGNVGIGTPNPNEKLHIIGNTRIEGTNPALYIRNTSTSADTYSIIRFGNSDGDNKAYIFLNGPKRTSDGGENVMTIRNNVGSLRLDNETSVTGLLSVNSGATHRGIKVGDNYINAINGNLIIQNNTAIRFGDDAWDYDVWAGLRYVSSAKTIHLGIADKSIFSANNALGGGTLNLPGIHHITSSFYNIKVSNVTEHTTSASGWYTIARVSGYFNYDIYTTGSWNHGIPSTVRVNICNINGTSKITQLSGYIGNLCSLIRLGKVSTDVWDVQVYIQGQSGPIGTQRYIFTGIGNLTVYDTNTISSTSYLATNTLAFGQISGVSLTSDNYTSYLDGQYLPLSGGLMDSDAYISWNNGADGNDVSDWKITGNGLRIISSITTTSNAPTQYSTALHVRGRYGFQLASAGGVGSNSFYIRNISNDNWNALIHSGNIGSQSVNYANSAGSAGNADTVDGYHVTDLLREFWTGEPGYNGSTYNSSPILTFSYANNTPYTGVFVDLNSNGYGVMFNTCYYSDTPLAYRRHGVEYDGGMGAWRYLIDNVTIGSQSVNYASSAGSSNYLKIHDIRNNNYAPNSTSWPLNNIRAWFNNTGTPNGDWWSGITVKGWTNDYNVWLLASTSTNHSYANFGLFFRTGNGSSWTNWKNVVTSESVNNIVVTTSLPATKVNNTIYILV